MITGYNTDVEHQGRAFHVQTEDKGLDNPIVETLIYCGGEILTSRRSSYEQLVGTERYSEEEVQRRMEAQHQGLEAMVDSAWRWHSRHPNGFQD